MNTDIIEYYKSMGFPPSEIVKRGVDRHGLTVYGIEDAMIRLYHDIRNGEQRVRTEEIVWKVWDIAAGIDSENYEDSAAERYEALKKYRHLQLTVHFYRGLVFGLILASIAYIFKELLL